METQKVNHTTQLCNKKVEDLETLMALFPAHELEAFYTEHSKQMLLTTSTQVERHEAMQKMLAILSGKS